MSIVRPAVHVLLGAARHVDRPGPTGRAAGTEEQTAPRRTLNRTKPETKPNDPFYNPPSGGANPPKPGARPTDARDLVVQRAFAGLGGTLADVVRNGAGLLSGNQPSFGHFDLYFLWSLERVGVIYGMDKIGGINWYDVGSTALVRSQSPDGSWNFKTYGAEVNTAFAVLFLLQVEPRPRPVEQGAEGSDQYRDALRVMALRLRSCCPTARAHLPRRRVQVRGAPRCRRSVDVPNPMGDLALTLAAGLLKATGADWTKRLGGLA